MPEALQSAGRRKGTPLTPNKNRFGATIKSLRLAANYVLHGNRDTLFHSLNAKYLS
jgi:hypothetical protein